jgi:phosphatidylinositol 3-kinase
MVEAMGEEKEKFKRYCFLAYTTLRKSSNLILNLVSLMIDAGIEHINQGDKSVLKVCDLTNGRLDYIDEIFSHFYYAS